MKRKYPQTAAFLRKFLNSAASKDVLQLYSLPFSTVAAISLAIFSGFLNGQDDEEEPQAALTA